MRTDGPVPAGATAGDEGTPTAALAVAETSRRQRVAADPATHAWVNANAGAGKTHVLVQRVVRILLNGTAPEKILCITYTKAAASEMAARIFRTLAGWAIADDTELSAILRDLGHTQASPALLERARSLFLRAIETPGGLKIQTIHAFCERLLKRFPLEAGIPAHFQVLDDSEQAALIAQAFERVLENAARGEQRAQAGDAAVPTLPEAIATLGLHATDTTLFDSARDLVLARERWPDVLSALRAGRGDEILTHYKQAFDLDNLDVATTQTQLLGVLPPADLRALIALLSFGGKTDQKAAAQLNGMAHVAATLGDSAPSHAAMPAIEAAMAQAASFFVTNEGTPKKRLMTKALCEQRPDLLSAAEAAQDAFIALQDKLRGQRIAQASLALSILAAEVIAQYDQLKTGRGRLDFTDLIAATARLLAQPADARWVLFKLDEGLDHVLLDEAQDTAPEQWRIIGALVEEIFDSTAEGDLPRTLFAVGDEKQSIYSFQGAEPELFITNRGHFVHKAEAAGMRFSATPLEVSFRSVPAVLQAVDAVFSSADADIGRPNGAPSVHHVAKRADQGGIVEVWPAVPAPDAPQEDIWAPDLGSTGADAPDASAGEPGAKRAVAAGPEVIAAQRVAATISHWLTSGRMLASAGRPVQPGDILILLARRGKMAGPLTRALKASGIPVAGLDRLDVLSQLAVQDLLAACRFILLPEDDLSLAESLKSPLFELNDDDLLALRQRGPGSLWQQLLRMEARCQDGQWSDHTQAQRFTVAAERLKRWRARADFLPPFEFLSSIVESDETRQRLMRRLGPEANEAINELLALAMAYDDRAAPSLQGFLGALETSRVEIKREMDKGGGEVRIMTVHGAKGLEAPIVILPDAARPGGGKTPAVHFLPKSTVPTDNAVKTEHQLEASARPVLPLMGIKCASSHSVVGAARLPASRREEQENLRLLYVAMTRAEDELYVGGFLNRKKSDQLTWHNRIDAAIADSAQAVPMGDAISQIWDAQPDAPVLRFAQAPTGSPDRSQEGSASGTADRPLPEWLQRRPPRPRVLPVPVAPSAIVPYDPERGAAAYEPEQGARILAFEDRAVAHVAAPQEATDAVRAAFGLSLGDGADQAPYATGAAAADRAATQGSPDARTRGLLIHALLQTLPDVPPQERAHLARAVVDARAPQLPPATRATIVDQVLRVIDAPETAPVFQPGSLAEVPIVCRLTLDDGTNVNAAQPLAIELSGQIDRLWVGDDTIVVADFKSGWPPRSGHPPDSYLAQLAAYRLALAQIYPARRIALWLVWTGNATVQVLGDEAATRGEQLLREAALARLR